MSAEEPRKPFQGLPRAFRLKRDRLIRPLFDRRRQDVGSIPEGCVRIVYRVVPREELDADVPVQVGFASGRGPGSSRRLSAVRRNRIKRVLREAYRTHQHDLLALFPGNRALTMMILYRGPYPRGPAGKPRAGNAAANEPPAGNTPSDDARIRADLPRALRKLHRRLRRTLMPPNAPPDESLVPSNAPPISSGEPLARPYDPSDPPNENPVSPERPTRSSR